MYCKAHSSLSTHVAAAMPHNQPNSAPFPFSTRSRALPSLLPPTKTLTPPAGTAAPAAAEQAPGSMVLPEELVEEVLLRLPPVDPASLFRAALVCKPWCRIISNRRFRRRFSEFHRSPPMLGLLCNFGDQDGDHVSRFLPTSSACPLRGVHNWRALDARHGRVLLSLLSDLDLSVWDPITDGWHQLPPVLDWQPECWNAAVLCASTASGACDHIDCRSGPFIVVAAICISHEMCLCVYSSDSSAWSELTYVPGRHMVHSMPTALVGNALYFVIDFSQRTLRYDLVTREISVIPLPTRSVWHNTMLMTMEDGGLGAAIRHLVPRLSLWSMQANPNGDIGWTEIRVIELGNLVTVNPPSITWNFVGFAYGIGVLFVEADGRLSSIELETGQLKMLCEGNGFHHIVLYSSWCTLALEAAAASTGEEPTRGASSASES